MDTVELERGARRLGSGKSLVLGYLRVWCSEICCTMLVGKSLVLTFWSSRYGNSVQVKFAEATFAYIYIFHRLLSCIGDFEGEPIILSVAIASYL